MGRTQKATKNIVTGLVNKAALDIPTLLLLAD